MTSFSQRKGLKPIKNIVQVDSMDADLRNGLWNVLCLFYWDKAEGRVGVSSIPDKTKPDDRNSIKESISAVESMCNLIMGTKDTLGEALIKVEVKLPFIQP